MIFIILLLFISLKFSLFLSVRLGDTLDLVLLLDGIAVGRVLGGVDELISKALSDGLDVAESRLSCL